MMGHLIYAGSTSYEMDDRTLAHLRAVIVTKLRQHQHFELSWAIDSNAGSGRVALTLDAGTPLQFTLEALLDAANSPRGLMLMSEADVERAVSAVV